MMDQTGGGNNVNNDPNVVCKQRLRWTHELHERFVDAVAQLGGPDRKFFSLKRTLLWSTPFHVLEKLNQYSNRYKIKMNPYNLLMSCRSYS